MTFYYSMKQMLRSPLKSILFFLLIGVTAFLLALGGNLWKMNTAMSKEFEEIFMTVGTATQKREQVKSYARWDAQKQEYDYFRGSTIGERIGNKVLDFEDAGYILKAKQRPHFGAYIDELYDGVGVDDQSVVEFTPYETGVANESFPVRVERVLSGSMEEGSTVYVCDHYSDEPRTLEAGKTYIAMLYYSTFVHGSRVSHIKPEDYVSEYEMYSSVESVQYTTDGERIYDPVNEAEGDNPALDVVTEGFYETERGKRWLKQAKVQDYYLSTVAVTPTDGTKLLMPFYNGASEITEGRDITREEYDKGAKVCLIPRELAAALKLKVGDKLKLPLYYADYSHTSAEMFGKGGGSYITSILNAQGEIYEVFNEQEYEVAGIYTGYESEGRDATGRNEVIIPWNALPENCWKDNIIGYGPMREVNTSFEIANGAIDDFTEKWEEQGIEGLEIRFYDKGYTQLQAGQESRKVMSWIFLISGIVLAVMILFFFASLFITGQQERIAVERLLGRTKKQCAASVLSGLLVLAAAGIMIGSAAGWAATGAATKESEETLQFDTLYSGVLVEGTKPDIDTVGGQMADPTAPLVSGSVLFICTFAVSAGFMKKTLKKEPLKILGTLEE